MGNDVHGYDFKVGTFSKFCLRSPPENSKIAFIVSNIRSEIWWFRNFKSQNTSREVRKVSTRNDPNCVVQHRITPTRRVVPSINGL